MSYNQFSILSCSFKSEQNQASLFLTIPLGHCDLCNFFISEMKSPSSTIVQKKETQFMCNSDGSSSTVSLCYVDENERKCMETVTDNEEDFPFGHFQRCCIAKLSPAQSNSNSVGWAEIALISTFTHPPAGKVPRRKFHYG